MAKKHPQIHLPSIIPPQDAVMDGKYELTVRKDRYDMVCIEWEKPQTSKTESEVGFANEVLIAFICLGSMFIIGTVVLIVA